MTDRGRTAVTSAMGSLFLTVLLGGFCLSSWPEVLAVFLTFTIGLFVTFGDLSDGSN
jgi:hypothetical protein